MRCQGGKFGIDAFDNILDQRWVHGFVHKAELGFRNRVGEYLCGTGIVLKEEIAIFFCRAVAPETVAAVVDEGGDFVLVKLARIRCRVLQIPENAS